MNTLPMEAFRDTVYGTTRDSTDNCKLKMNRRIIKYNCIYKKRDFFLGLFVGIVVTYLTTLTSLQSRFQKSKSSEKAEIMVLNDDRLAHHDDNNIAENLEKRVRVLCYVMTCPKNLETRAIHVKKTWGKRCNILLFMSSVSNSSFPTIGLNVSEGRQHLTQKESGAFDYIFENYRDKADWFLKADDDTYVILENLRYFLKDYNTSDPIFFGHHFKMFSKQGYFSGGAGYVLSREALTRLGTKGKDPKLCRKDGAASDAATGQCLEKVGVKVVNSSDALGRSRFHCFQPESHLFGDYPKWYYKYDANGPRKGMESISDHAISFHYVNPKLMHVMDLLIYHLKPYGIHSTK
ncbi:glycoprotein-N-acetylgalactosamine 3-beta-galactosyltransferase 1-B-like [Mytilus californianus]|uniref:glycoprotein-N-acetylgalactosamine 3-beta-galactosyltransferase 1-B-like n=1 Tax=Mytilus californianus TaxID=6549 RepID=UPI002247F1F4|nr:glycoprotein-N-acetylgalactosamine 3-beta-galactosyltransferase 1-B-like [Mytilus californianus]XP_052064999.1 glycoprotein-N-acetylgalactosamine 3-beta-galactosyltransferase 1-B-like [Mytilus californianus]